MKNFFVILSLVFYATGQIFLPQGNFAYIEQIPHLYTDFCETNGSNDVCEFIQEQFLEFEFAFDLKNENIPLEENESKPVPFHTPCGQIPLALVQSIETELITFPEKINTHYFTYILKEHWVHAASIYHPPKNKLA